MDIVTFDVTLEFNPDEQDDIASQIESAIERKLTELGLTVDNLVKYYYTLDIPVSLDINREK